MKLKILPIIVLSLFSNKIISQEIEDVNPKGKTFFGVEIGTNHINSFDAGGNKSSFQAGVLGEYYFARHWSVSGRFKYFETGVSFYQPNEGGWFGDEEHSGTFKGEVIAIPIDLKWEFRVSENLGAGLKLGAAPTMETKSNYSNYSNNISKSEQPYYIAFNYGIGLNYFINKETAVYIDYEGYVGQSKGHYPGFMGGTYYYAENALLNFGIKYTFEEDKKSEQSTDSDTD